MYTEKEVKELLKLQKKVCSNVASANWGSHVGKSVLKSPDVPLVKSTLAPVSLDEQSEATVCEHAYGEKGCCMMDNNESCTPSPEGSGCS